MESISFPRNEDEIRQHILAARAADRTVTIQGMRTGIAGGAVPQGGHVLNLNRMTRILGLRRDEGQNHYLMTLEPGVFLREQMWPATTVKEFDTVGWSAQSLEALEAFRADPPYLFPPDPSEPTISLGGMVANNASGARSFHYGPTREWVEWVRVILADGSAVEARRGVDKAHGRDFLLATDAGRTIEFRLPDYTTPEIKTSAGYFARGEMDLVDLFVGSEGTLGVVSEIEVRLIPEPTQLAAAMVFFESEVDALDFVRAMRDAHYRPTALELYDHHSIDLMRAKRHIFAPHQRGNEIPPGTWSAIYYEFHTNNEADSSAAREEMFATASDHGAPCGGPFEQIWHDTGMAALKSFKQIKHMLPELVNSIVAERQESEPRLRKLGTDFAVPDERLGDLVALYHRDLDGAGFEHLIFGHVGDNNLHVNIIPRDFDEYQRGQQIYLEWARAAIEMGGTVSAEHGIGKIKKHLAREMFCEHDLDAMRAVKRAFDPDWMMNRGNMFDP